MDQKIIKPPKAAQWILERIAKFGEKFSVAGDFEEEFNEVALRKGVFKARAWYWFHVAVSFVTFLGYAIRINNMMTKNYLKVALRNIRRHKSYSLINIFGLTVGITCSLLITLYVNDELSYDSSHENAKNIYRLVSDLRNERGTMSTAFTPAPWGPVLKEEFPEIVDAVRFHYYREAILVSTDEKVFYEDNFFWADPSVFTVFSFPLVKGDAATVMAAPDAIVITEEMAKKYFGDEDPIGKTMRYGDQALLTVAGIMKNMPQNLHLKPDFLANFNKLDDVFPDIIDNWTINWYHTYILMEPNASPEELEQKLPDFLSKHINEVFTSRYTGSLQPLTSIHTSSNRLDEISVNTNISYVYSLAAVAVIILVIACINFMNIATARAARRSREIGLRKVLGSSKYQLIKQILGESTLLSFISLILSLPLTWLFLPVLNAFSGKEMAFVDPGIGTLVIGTVLLGLFVGLFSGIYPAAVLTSAKFTNILRSKHNLNVHSPIRRLLVTVQFSATIIILVATGVIYNQLEFVQNKNLGFNKENTLSVPLRNVRVQENYEVYKDAILKNTNVLNASAASHYLGGAMYRGRFIVRGNKGENWQQVAIRIQVDHDYLHTFDVDLAAGRSFAKEFVTDATNAFIVNESFVRNLGLDSPDELVNTQVRFEGRTGTIIGVMKDIHTRSLHYQVSPLVLLIDPGRFRYLSVKINANNTAETIDFLRQTWETFSPDLPFSFTFQEEYLNRLYAEEQKFGLVFRVFAILSIVISCIGLLGLAMFISEQRTKEIAIRKVLGSSVKNLFLLLSGEFLKFVLIANIVAVPLGYFMMDKWLQSFSYRADMGMGVFIFSIITVALIALITVSIQSLKTATSNPIKSLRYE